jgi:acyl dehydratase
MQSIKRFNNTGNWGRCAFSSRQQNINGYHPPSPGVAAAAATYETSTMSNKGTDQTAATVQTSRGGGGGGEEEEFGNSVPSSKDSIRGEILDLAADLRQFRPGDKLDIPYELTVSEAMQEFWQSAFHSQDRINTSRPFCRRMGLQDRVLPFSLALFLTSSMTHADAAKVQVGFGRVNYLWPCFAGDTFTKSFTVESIRNTSDGNHSVFHFNCDLINQRGRLCMRADKRMLFEFPVPSSSVKASSSRNKSGDDPVNLHLFRDHLLSKSHVCQELQSHSLADLRPGQLILHSMNRSITFTQAQQLASLARLTHERHFDTRRFEQSELLIPGGLVLGIVQSAASRDFHEILHEELLHVNYVNSLHPGNIVGAISYIQSVEEAVGDLEICTVRTLGIKNMDVMRDLKGVDIPLELLQMYPHGRSIKTKDIQRICKSHCPQLHGKIVLLMDRRILRQARHEEVFLL